MDAETIIFFIHVILQAETESTYLDTHQLVPYIQLGLENTAKALNKLSHPVAMIPISHLSSNNIQKHK